MSRVRAVHIIGMLGKGGAVLGSAGCISLVWVVFGGICWPLAILGDFLAISGDILAIFKRYLAIFGDIWRHSGDIWRYSCDILAIF